jgi:hypothetical protein
MSEQREPLTDISPRCGTFVNCLQFLWLTFDVEFIYVIVVVIDVVNTFCHVKKKIKCWHIELCK